MKTIHESLSLSATPLKGNRIRIKIIDAGEGSSGIYPGSTIKLAAEENVFKAGLHMYADHPTAQEGYDRPERTIKDLAAVLETDAVHVPEESALYADAKVFPNWREAIAEMADSIGVSIRASAEISESETGGKPTIERIVEAFSVDFVTKAGRGGRIAEVLESAGSAERAVERGVEEATANDTRELLLASLRAAAGEDAYLWVRDFDAANVWYSAEDDGLYQRSYTLDGDTITLSGEPVPVVARTSYVPIQAATEAASEDSPSVPAGVTENGKGPIVATTNIEESALADLQAKASRVAALEADNQALSRRLLTADALKIVGEAFDGITAPKTIARLAESAPVREDGTLDEEALKADAVEAAAEWRVGQGEGTVRGLGETNPATPAAQESAEEPSDADIVTVLKGA